MLSESRLPRRLVVVLTDFAASGWAGLEAPWVTRRPPRVQVVDVAQGKSMPNLAITQASVGPASTGYGRARLRVTVVRIPTSTPDSQCCTPVRLFDMSATTSLNASSTRFAFFHSDM